MLTRIAVALSLLLSFVAVDGSEAQTQLTVVSGRPAGETADLGESREVTVVFSEPMVALGRIPNPVTAPFFKIQPALAGTFRWSGTSILIFTPDPKVALPFSTRYTVTIDASATAVSGHKLAAPYTFAFSTPTVKLLATNWYRRGNRFDGPIVIGLRFNQPVRPVDLLQRLTLAYKTHDWTPPEMSAVARARMQATEPAGLAAFEAKVAAATAAANSTARVVVSSTATWDVARLGKAEPTLVVLQTTTAPPTESWIELTVPTGMRGLQGSVTTPRPQTYTMELEPTFFVDEPKCRTECDPDQWNPVRLRREVLTDTARKAFSLTDITTATAKPLARKPGPAAEGDSDRSDAFTLEDLGYDPQKPASKYALRLEPTLRAVDGQTLGYPWIGVVENWHATAFTSFGDGHGVWESTGGTVLPFYARNFTSVRQWVAAIAPLELMPTILALQGNGFKGTPDGTPQNRRLTPQADRIQSYGIDLARALTGGHGLVWAAVEEGQTIQRSRTYGDPQRTRATVVQVTNLGLTVKDSPQNTLVFVTRLDNALPVEGAKVSIVTIGNQVAWTGTTNADGVAIAPALPLRGPKRWYDTKFEFLVMAEKDGDAAYLGSDWTEGDRSLGVRHQLRRRRAELAAAGHGVRGSRRLSPRRGGALQGDPPPRHRRRHQGAGRRYAGLRQRARQPGSRDRSARGEAVGVGLGRVDADAAGRRRARQLFGADAAAAVHHRDEEAIRGAGARAERRQRSRGRARRRRAARLGHRRLPRGGLPPARFPRRRHPDQRDAVRRRHADRHRDGPLPVRGADEDRAGALDLLAHGGLRRAVVAAPQLSPRGLRLRRPAVVLRPHRTARRRGRDRRRRRLRGRARDQGRRRRPLRLPDRGRGHRRVAAADRQPRLDQRASGRRLRRRQAALLRRSVGRSERRARRPHAGGRLRSRHRHRGHRAARAVDQHAPRRRQRLLYVGHRGEGHRRRHVAREIGTRAGDAAASAQGRRLLQAARRVEGRRGPSRRRGDRVLRPRTGLHGVDALRPQPHRPRARAQELRARATRRGS